MWNPIDHTDLLADTKYELKKSHEWEEQLLTFIQQLQTEREELKKALAKSKWKFEAKTRD